MQREGRDILELCTLQEELLCVYEQASPPNAAKYPSGARPRLLHGNRCLLSTY